MEPPCLPPNLAVADLAVADYSPQVCLANGFLVLAVATLVLGVAMTYSVSPR